MIKTAIILGAGAGTRLRPLTYTRPKPLLPVLNKTMLEWWAEFMVSAGVKRVVINVHYQAEMMLARIEKLAASFNGKLEILPSLEEKVLGTGGGIKQAASLLGKNEFLVANADIFTDFELVKLALKQLANPDRLATIGLLEKKPRANVAVGEGDRVLGFRREGPVEGELARKTYCGVMALNSRIFDLIPEGECDLIDVFNRAMSDGQEISGWTYDPAIWRDMGTPDDYWDLNRRLTAGRTIIHSTARVDGEIRGWNVLGADSIVAPKALVENSVLWAGAVVSSGATVKNAIVTGIVPPEMTIDGGVYCEAQSA